MEMPFAPPTARATSDQHLAEVVSVKDVGSTGRVSVRLLGYDGVAGQDAVLSARLCVPYAGGGRGAFLVPDVGDEVVVSFLNGDARQAVVMGAVWNGKNRPAEKLGGSGEKVDRWSFVGKSGTRIAIVEENGGALIKLSANSGGSTEIASCVIDRKGGGSIELKVGSTVLRLDPRGVKVTTPGKLEMKASTTELSSASVKVKSIFSEFTGIVKTLVTQAISIDGKTYTPGAGNIW